MLLQKRAKAQLEINDLVRGLLFTTNIGCSNGYNLVCVDDEFSKSFRSYLGKDAICSFINSMMEESKYCSDVMKEHFNKEIVMTKKDDEGFENSTKL